MLVTNDLLKNELFKLLNPRKKSRRVSLRIVVDTVFYLDIVFSIHLMKFKNSSYLKVANSRNF